MGFREKHICFLAFRSLCITAAWAYLSSQGRSRSVARVVVHKAPGTALQSGSPSTNGRKGPASDRYAHAVAR